MPVGELNANSYEFMGPMMDLLPDVHVGRVRMVTDGQIVSESYGEQWYAGNTALLHVGQVTLILTHRR